jgi:hypothetical protein
MRFQLKYIFFVCAILLMAMPVFAHRPYEHIAGTFQRSDGKTITIVLRYVDGIVVSDPVSVQFRLPDGIEVAHTPRANDAIVRYVPSAIEIYQFPSNWIPVADRVDSFNGYVLQDITSSRRTISPLIHFANYWLGYLVTLGIALFYVSIWHRLQTKPQRKWQAVSRVAAFTFLVLYAYYLLMFAPISPLVVIVCVSIFTLIYGLIRKKWQAGILKRSI